MLRCCEFCKQQKIVTEWENPRKNVRMVNGRNMYFSEEFKCCTDCYEICERKAVYKNSEDFCRFCKDRQILYNWRKDLTCCFNCYNKHFFRKISRISCIFCKKVKTLTEWGEYESCDDCHKIIKNLKNNCQVCKKEKAVVEFDTGYSCGDCNTMLTKNNKTILDMNLEQNSINIVTICKFCKQYKLLNRNKFEDCCDECGLILLSLPKIEQFVCKNKDHKNKPCDCNLCCICLTYTKQVIYLHNSDHFLCYQCKNKLQTTQCPMCRADIS